jgi:MFS family permease
MALSPNGAARGASLARRAVAPPLVERLPWGIGLDAVLVGSLLAVAGLVRKEHLLLSPQFPSVTETIMMALDMADGRAFYLSDGAPYIGAPFVWLLALVYRMVGPSLDATMLVPWAIGTLTLVPTYLLGREVGGRVVGAIAAALLATSGAHTVISSHVPLSHSLTPLVTTTTLWLLAVALRSPLATGGRLLAAAGLLAGLALQTHPTAAPLLAGAALGALLMRRDWLRTRWPAIALALVVVGYSTLLVYHLTSHFAVVADVQGKQARYLDADHDAGEDDSHGVYLSNLDQLLLSTARMVSGAIEDRETPADYLTDPTVLAPVGLALAGLLVAARRRSWWMVGAVLLSVLLPPAFSGKYRPILDGRYLMPLIPLLFVAVGLAISTLIRVVAASTAIGLPQRIARVGALAALAFGTTLLVAHPLALLDTFYKDSIEDGFSNATYLATLRHIEAARRNGEAVLLDERLDQVKSAGGGKASNSLTWLLAVSRVPAEPLADVTQPTALTGRLAILQRDTADRLDNEVKLEPLDGRRLTGRDRPSYRAYRIGDRPAR